MDKKRMVNKLMEEIETLEIKIKMAYESIGKFETAKYREKYERDLVHFSNTCTRKIALLEVVSKIEEA